LNVVVDKGKTFLELLSSED